MFSTKVSGATVENDVPHIDDIFFFVIGVDVYIKKQENNIAMSTNKQTDSKTLFELPIAKDTIFIDRRTVICFQIR